MYVPVLLESTSNFPGRGAGNSLFFVESVPARNEKLEGLNARLVAHVDCSLLRDNRVSCTYS